MNNVRTVICALARSAPALQLQLKSGSKCCSSIYRTIPQRFLSNTCTRFDSKKATAENVDDTSAAGEVAQGDGETEAPVAASEETAVIEVPKVRRSVRGTPYTVYPVEVSIQYMQSDAYKQVYGDLPIWKPYRRNLIGQFPSKTRRRCVRGGVIATGSACPVCRDSYLVVDYRNVALLRQFVDASSGHVLDSKKTNVCQHVQYKLEVEVEKAFEYGYLEMPLSHHTFKYSDYFASLRQHQSNTNQPQTPHTLTDFELMNI